MLTVILIFKIKLVCNPYVLTVTFSTGMPFGSQFHYLYESRNKNVVSEKSSDRCKYGKTGERKRKREGERKKQSTGSRMRGKFTR